MLKYFPHFHESDDEHHHCLTDWDCLPWSALVCDECGRTIVQYGPTGSLYIATDVPEDCECVCDHRHHLPEQDVRKPRNKFPSAKKTDYCTGCMHHTYA